MVFERSCGKKIMILLLNCFDGVSCPGGERYVIHVACD